MIRAGMVLPSIAIGLGVGLSVAVVQLPTRADDPPTAAVEFDRDVQPILETRCLSCHGGPKLKGGLDLGRKARALAGGDSGPAIVPGHAVESELIARVEGEDETTVMPPEGDRLTSAQVAVLRAWIDQGAPWPEGSAASGARPEPSHWAFRAPVRPAPPTVRDPSWPRSALDRFILARLDREGVSPSPEADRATLIRRLSLDLLGLPPEPADVQAFLGDSRPDAYERLVDRLLSSPHFGERWGRHWLDLARYADSDGYEKDSPRPDAFRYRDWVIAAVNRDLPFDRFTIEQLAGDLLPGATLDQRTATGFHRNTLTNKEGGADPEEFRVAAVVDRVNTTGTVWLGLTVACAQCHTHKYDPILQREYYRLFAFFNTADEIDLPFDPGAPAPAGPPKKKPAQPVVRTIGQPAGAARATQILIRGDFLRPGETVEPGTPEVLPPLKSEGPAPTRLDLARWLVAPENPLTARVEVNRVWRNLFGRPLVASVEDFGTRGEHPTHPELLDWLALEFQRVGWSRKALIRSIVTSATYRQSSAGRPELRDRDLNNTWIARQNRFRVEAEIIRDLSLAAGGLLHRRIGGPSVRPPQPPGISELTYSNSAKWVESRGPDRLRRGMYTHFQRTSPYPSLMTFDAPDANVCSVKRERSNTPLQALTLLNDPVFVECAQGLARRVLSSTGPEKPAGPEPLGGPDAASASGSRSDRRRSQAFECPLQPRESGADATTESRVRHLYRLALGREPDAEDRVALTQLLASLRHDFESRPAEARSLAADACAAGTDPAEAAAWVGVTRAVLNLDEFLTRE